MASKLQAALSGVSAPSISLKGVQGTSYRAQNVQVNQPKPQTDYAGGLLQVAQIGTQAVGMYNEMMEKRALKRSQEVLNKFSTEEIGALRKSGVLLYQDDPWAMRALNRELGRQESYNVDSIIAERIKNGDYNSRSAMEEDRNKLLGERRKSMPEAFGLSEDDEGFNEGYNADMGQRNMHLFNSQAVKQDQMMRNETRVVLENNINAFVRSPQIDSTQIVQYLNAQKAQGMIRNDTEFETYYTKAVDAMSQRADGVRVVEDMLNADIELYGQKTTLGNRIGQEGSDVYRNKAIEANVHKDAEARLYFTNGLSELANPDFTDDRVYEKSMDKLNEMVSYVSSLGASPAALELRVKVEEAALSLKNKLGQYNARKSEELVKTKQKNVRMNTILSDIHARVNGDIIDVFRSRAEDETTGSFTDSDYVAAFEQYAASIQSSDATQQQKDMKMMQVASLFKDNKNVVFGSYYKTLTGDLAKELQQYDLALQSGNEPPETPIMNSMQSMYRTDPQFFLQTFGQDAEFALQIATADSLGISPVAYRKGSIEISKLSKADQMVRQQEMLNKLTENGGDAQVLQRLGEKEKAAYLAMWTALDGLTAPERTKAIIDHINANNVVVKQGNVRGYVSRNFLNVNPSSKDSVKEGQAMLESFVKDNWGDFPVAIEQDGDNIIIFGMNADAFTISQQMLLDWNKAKQQQVK